MIDAVPCYSNLHLVIWNKKVYFPVGLIVYTVSKESNNHESFYGNNNNYVDFFSVWILYTVLSYYEIGS